MKIHEVSAARIREEIEQGLVRDDRVDVDRIQVGFDDGLVTLTGTVSSWSARERVEGLARTACDGRRIQNHITVKRHGRAAF